MQKVGRPLAPTALTMMAPRKSVKSVRTEPTLIMVPPHAASALLVTFVERVTNPPVSLVGILLLVLKSVLHVPRGLPAHLQVIRNVGRDGILMRKVPQLVNRAPRDSSALTKLQLQSSVLWGNFQVEILTNVVIVLQAFMLIKRDRPFVQPAQQDRNALTQLLFQGNALWVHIRS